MLAECGRGGPCPGLATALKKAGLTTAAEAKWVSKMPVEGFKSATQMLDQEYNNYGQVRSRLRFFFFIRGARVSDFG